jgi:hypothetical protein
MVEPWSRCSNSAATGSRVPRKHHVPPSFPGLRSTASQGVQSILFSLCLRIAAGLSVVRQGPAASALNSIAGKTPLPTAQPRQARSGYARNGGRGGQCASGVRAGGVELWKAHSAHRGQKLSIEDDQTILGTGQLSDTDRIAPKHLGRNLGWIIAGSENDYIGARDLAQQTPEIAVGRHEDEVRRGRVFENPEIASTAKAILKRTFGPREKIAQQCHQLRREAFVEQELHPPETLRPAVNSAA